jgi:hypothetical protein
MCQSIRVGSTTRCGPESHINLGAGTTTIRKHQFPDDAQTLDREITRQDMHNEGSSLVVAHCIMGNMADLYCEMYGIIVIDPRKVNMLQSRLAIHLTQYLTNAATSRSVSIHDNPRGCRQRNRGLQSVTSCPMRTSVASVHLRRWWCNYCCCISTSGELLGGRAASSIWPSV